MIRLIIAVLFVVIFLIVSIPIWGVLAVVSLFNKKAADKAGFRIVQGAFKIVYKIAGTKIILKGQENILDEPCVYMGNHLGFFDVIISYSQMKNITGFLSKDSFKKVPLLSYWMKRNYCLFLNRSDVREGMKTILQAIEYVNSGISMFIFPEGTRSKTGEMAEFKDGSFKVATKTGVPIVPVAFVNTGEVLEAHFPHVKKTTVVIEYGKPIYVDQLEAEDKKHIGAYTRNIVYNMVEENKKLL